MKVNQYSPLSVARLEVKKACKEWKRVNPADVDIVKYTYARYQDAIKNYRAVKRMTKGV